MSSLKENPKSKMYFKIRFIECDFGKMRTSNKIHLLQKTTDFTKKICKNYKQKGSKRNKILNIDNL